MAACHQLSLHVSLSWPPLELPRMTVYTCVLTRVWEHALCAPDILALDLSGNEHGVPYRYACQHSGLQGSYGMDVCLSVCMHATCF